MAVISGWVTYEELDKIQLAGYGVVVKHGGDIAGHEEAWVDVNVDCNVVDLLDLEGGGPGTSSWFRAELDRVRENANKALDLLSEAAPAVDAYEEAEAEERREIKRHNRLMGYSTEEQPPLNPVSYTHLTLPTN